MTSALSSHSSIHVLRLDVENHESSLKKAFGSLSHVEDLMKVCAFIKTTRAEWINRTPDGKAIAKQYQTEMKPLKAEATAILDELKKQERESHATGGGGGGSASKSSAELAAPPTPPPIPVSMSSAATSPSTPLSATAAIDSSSLPLLLEVTGDITEVKDEPDTYTWPATVRTGVLSPGASLRLKSMRDVLFIGCLKGVSIKIRTPEGELIKAAKAVPGAFPIVFNAMLCLRGCDTQFASRVRALVPYVFVQATSACSS